jgi:ketosteroid isomerase-like protein
MPDSITEELLQLTHRLLDSIAQRDWETYQELCDPTLTAFEPQAHGQLVEGMDFHHFYFNLSGQQRNQQTTLCAPHVRVMGDVAVVAYIRLHQKLNAEGVPVTHGFEETRIWQKQQGRWRHVHFHRSPLPG